MLKLELKKRKEIKIPHSYVIIFSMILVAAVLTYIIPSGEYTRIENSQGITVVDPGSFKYVETKAAGIMDILNAVPAGLMKTAELIFFIFIVGGAFQIVTGTGAIDVLIGKLIYSLKGRTGFIIPIVMFVFSLGGAAIGMSNEILPFIPIGIMIARKAGYDTVVGTAMIAIGTNAGFVAGVMNPFTVGISQSLAGLPIFSGMTLRIILHIVLLGSACIYIMRYAKKVKANPELSIVRDLELESLNGTEGEVRSDAKLRDYLVILTFVMGLAWIIFGVINYQWDTKEMQPIFIAIGIACGFVGGLGPNRIAKEFVTGAKAMVFGAIVVGIARGILVILQDGMILDTMINGLLPILDVLPAAVAPIGMYAVNTILNIFISSGSGLAASTMPLFLPLADLLGVTRQVAVLAFQLGDGVTNCISPTSGNMNAYLSLSKISYTKWVKFIGPLVLIWATIGVIFILVGNLIGYGPF